MAGRCEGSPHDIRELRREEQHRERRPWREPLGRQGDPEVSYEHRVTAP
jgi:hypothetical protein